MGKEKLKIMQLQHDVFEWIGLYFVRPAMQEEDRAVR